MRKRHVHVAAVMLSLTLLLSSCAVLNGAESRSPTPTAPKPTIAAVPEVPRWMLGDSDEDAARMTGMPDKEDTGTEPAPPPSSPPDITASPSASPSAFEIDAEALKDKPYNLIAWSLGCSAILASLEKDRDPYTYGMFDKDGSHAEAERRSMADAWGIRNHDELVDTIRRMTDEGHNSTFCETYDIVKDLTDARYAAFTAGLSETDAYMFNLTKMLGDKWGDKQIKAWDWFRMFHIAGWGYNLGYIGLEESYELLEPVIERLRGTFSSWEEASDNYMDGYLWWSMGDTEQYGIRYRNFWALYALPSGETLFDESLWES